MTGQDIVKLRMFPNVTFRSKNFFQPLQGLFFRNWKESWDLYFKGKILLDVWEKEKIARLPPSNLGKK